MIRALLMLLLINPTAFASGPSLPPLQPFVYSILFIVFGVSLALFLKNRNSSESKRSKKIKILRVFLTLFFAFIGFAISFIFFAYGIAHDAYELFWIIGFITFLFGCIGDGLGRKLQKPSKQISVK